MGFLLTPGLFLLALLLIGRRRDPTAVGAQAVVRRISQALAAAGAVQTASLLFLHSTWTLDLGPLLLGSMAAASFLLAILWAFAIPGQGFRSLVRWFVLGAFGTFSCSAALLRDVNRDFDFRPPLSRTVRVVNKQASTTLRGGTNYYLRLEDWTNEGRARELDLSKRQFQHFAIQQMVVFEEHRGALGFRWIGRLRAA
jgi:hypothetical protein